MKHPQLLVSTLQTMYNSHINASNDCFDKYTDYRKKRGIDTLCLTEYARSGSYDTAAKTIETFAAINGIPLDERVTKYANDTAFEVGRYDSEITIPEAELELQEA